MISEVIIGASNISLPRPGYFKIIFCELRPFLLKDHFLTSDPGKTAIVSQTLAPNLYIKPNVVIATDNLFLFTTPFGHYRHI